MYCIVCYDVRSFYRTQVYSRSNLAVAAIVLPFAIGFRWGYAFMIYDAVILVN